MIQDIHEQVQFRTQRGTCLLTRTNRKEPLENCSKHQEPLKRTGKKPTVFIEKSKIPIWGFITCPNPTAILCIILLT